MIARIVLETLTAPALVRRLTDAVMARYAARRTAQLDRGSPMRQQERTLRRLVRQARHTRFGRDHDFAAIRSVADYQRRVPLRTYEAFWSDYWQIPFPYLHHSTWPGAIRYFALSSGTSSGVTKYLPISSQMFASNQKAALTALALFLSAQPGTPLFGGRLFFLGGSSDLRALHQDRTPFPVWAGDLSGITQREASPLLRPFTFPPEELALLSDWDEKVQRLAERAASLPITMLSGVPSWLLVLFERLRQITGRERIAEIWPRLRVVIHGGTMFEPYRALFQQIIGDPAVHFLESYPASEGFIAAEDPRYGLLRLLPDHGIFFEFVPCEDLGSDRPARHTVSDFELGVRYAVVLTTCAGLWSYVLGDTIRFERRHPPLLRFIGRTSQFLSAFGEHLIGEEIEKAVTSAAAAVGAAVVDFHVGPIFAFSPGRHRWFVEFSETICPHRLQRFAHELDAALCRMNEDYADHRRGDLALAAPEIFAVHRGGFADWMRSIGRLGGQNKVPRMDNSGKITEEMSSFFR